MLDSCVKLAHIVVVARRNRTLYLSDQVYSILLRVSKDLGLSVSRVLEWIVTGRIDLKKYLL